MEGKDREDIPYFWEDSKEARIPYPNVKKASLLNRFFLKQANRSGNSKCDLHLFTMMLYHKSCYVPYLLYLQGLLSKGTIPMLEKDRIIIRAAWRLDCPYEYTHHVNMGLRHGLSKEEIVSLTQETSGDWDGRTRAVMAAVDELTAKRDLSSPAWEALKAYYTDQQMYEFIALVSNYDMVAIIDNTLRVPVEPEHRISSGREPL